MARGKCKRGSKKAPEEEAAEEEGDDEESSSSNKRICSGGGKSASVAKVRATCKVNSSITCQLIEFQ